MSKTQSAAGTQSMPVKKVIVLASGGLDSTTLLWKYAELVGAKNVVALSVDYGQRHHAELDRIEKIVARLGCAHHTIHLNEVFSESSSTLVGPGVKAELDTRTYVEQGRESALIQTNVELRNLVFISVASSYAMQCGADIVAVGFHASDYAYPDCSPDFVEALARAISLGSAGTVTLEAPLRHFDKADVVKLGTTLGVPYELTRSCYEKGDAPCGRCATCLDRARAFREAGRTDPALDMKTEEEVENVRNS